MTEEVARLEGQIKALIERLNQVRKDMPTIEVPQSCIYHERMDSMASYSIWNL